MDGDDIPIDSAPSVRTEGPADISPSQGILFTWPMLATIVLSVGVAVYLAKLLATRSGLLGSRTMPRPEEAPGANESRESLATGLTAQNGGTSTAVLALEQNGAAPVHSQSVPDEAWSDSGGSLRTASAQLLRIIVARLLAAAPQTDTAPVFLEGDADDGNGQGERSRGMLDGAMQHRRRRETLYDDFQS
ncbi:hypothetical protein OH77DRAFT_1429864 [Trametes cingulata]|nr:hypothetical protein OH77DRAFT_1429864 [Trametes cingulata]